MEDVTFTAAVTIANRVRTGNLSAVDVVDAYLDRIDERDDALHAYVTVDETGARERAREIDAAVAKGDEVGPLCGVPVGIKDLYDVVGLPTSQGSPLFADDVATEDALLVARLRAADAIIIGKTNTPQFGRSGATYNDLAGATATPFDASLTAGGSSGGSAAAVADGMAALAQGSDAGGSIRIPAAFCGVYGLKPSYGRIPMIKRPNGFSHFTPMCDVGPIARTVADAAVMLDVMAGPHPRDPVCLPPPETRYVEAVDQPIDHLRIAYSPDLGTFPVLPEIQAVVDEAVGEFADETSATVDRVDMDLGLSVDEILETMYDTWSLAGHAAANEQLTETDGLDLYADHREHLTEYDIDTIEKGRTLGAVEYLRADEPRTCVFDGLQDIFTDYDILLSATVSVPPFDKWADTPTHEDIPEKGWHVTLPYNFSGHPAASAPAGMTADGLPAGLQIAGRRFRDDTVLSVSGAYEAIRPWVDALPGYPTS